MPFFQFSMYFSFFPLSFFLSFSSFFYFFDIFLYLLLVFSGWAIVAPTVAWAESSPLLLDTSEPLPGWVGGGCRAVACTPKE